MKGFLGAKIFSLDTELCFFLYCIPHFNYMRKKEGLTKKDVEKPTSRKEMRTCHSDTTERY
jgi:hypothetical protein